MPIHIKTNGGYFKAGKMYGEGEVYIENSDTGEGEIRIGNFDKGKLNDINGIYITYDNNSYKKYIGTFIYDILDGTAEVYEFITSEPETDDEKKIDGNGHNCQNGRRYISACTNNTTIIGKKKSVIFSNGIQGATLSEVDQNMNIHIFQKNFNGRNIFTRFQISI